MNGHFFSRWHFRRLTFKQVVRCSIVNVSSILTVLDWSPRRSQMNGPGQTLSNPEYKPDGTVNARDNPGWILSAPNVLKCLKQYPKLTQSWL